ncbi:MAG TPA: MFS transporter [Casimicrobiaceae bacterium]|nr:MFS transporter [Casimicrobiaceae bacterium]
MSATPAAAAVEPRQPAHTMRVQASAAARESAPSVVPDRPSDGARFIGWRYGLLGLPLAFVSLPLYVTLPHHYAEQYGVPLAALGVVLLATRMLDAVLDPIIGRWVDRLFALGYTRAWAAAACGAFTMAVGFTSLWLPPAKGPTFVLGWLAGALVVTYLSFSVVTVVHQAWGARWGGSEQQRARIVAWREGAALVGVVAASLLPSFLGLSLTSAALALMLALGVALLGRSGSFGADPATAFAAAPAAASASFQPHASPWRSPAFRALLGVFMFNGTASAVPATLLPFFVADRLQAGVFEPLFLTLYFVCAAIGLPLWVRAVPRLGLARTWLAGMALSVATFSAVLGLSAGDVAGFAAVCAFSGLALGADLAVPGALLTGVVRHAGAAERGEGQFFGWWACATKLNLALAAGLVLPLLAAAGYHSGARDAAALSALTLAYGALPCVLKLTAAAWLWRAHRLHPALGAPA